MNAKILLLALTAASISSCSTSYKTGQTPDDVYYSPSRPEEEYVQRENRDEDRKYSRRDESYYEDQYLRMKVRNRYRWSDLDDPYYYSRRYNYITYNCCCFGNPWTPFSYWNNHYNPYNTSPVILNPKTSTVYTGPRTFNLASYNNNAITNNNYSNPKTNHNAGSNNNGTYYNSNSNSSPRYKPARDESNSGNILREVFNSGGTKNNSSSNSSSNNNNSSSSSSSSSSGSSSSSSSPAPVRRF